MPPDSAWHWQQHSPWTPTRCNPDPGHSRLAWFPQQQRGPWTPMLPHHRPLKGPSDDRSTDINSSFLSCSRASNQCLALGHSPRHLPGLGWPTSHSCHPVPHHLSTQTTNHSTSPSLLLLYPVLSHHYGAQPPSKWAFSWVTGGTWMNTAHPSHKEWRLAVASPLPYSWA